MSEHPNVTLARHVFGDDLGPTATAMQAVSPMPAGNLTRSNEWEPMQCGPSHPLKTGVGDV